MLVQVEEQQALIQKLKIEISGLQAQLVDSDNHQACKEHERQLQLEIDNLKEEIRILRFENSGSNLEQVIIQLREENKILLQKIGSLKIEISSVRDSTKTEYVHVPVTNAEAESYKEAIRRVAQLYPAITPYTAQIEAVKDQLWHGQKIIAGDKRKPLVQDNR